MRRTIDEILDEYMEQVGLVKQGMNCFRIDEILNLSDTVYLRPIEELEPKVSSTGDTKCSCVDSIRDIRLKKFGWKIEIPNEPAAYMGSGMFGGYIPPIKSDDRKVTKDEITFNGNPIADVISYDEKAGEIHYYERHWSTGDLVPDGTDPTGYRTVKDKGQVKVIKKYSDPSTNYPGYSGDMGCGLDLNSDPSAPCGIDPNYVPWYPYGTPSFCEVAQTVEFEFCGFDDVHLIGRNPSNNLPQISQASMLDKLVIDGVDLSVGWTLVSVDEDRGSLSLCFVKLALELDGFLSLAKGADLYSLQLQGKAYAAMGYPHIYKIVKIARGNFSASISPIGSTVEDPTTWPPGTKINICVGNADYFSKVDPVTLSTLRKLC